MKPGRECLRRVFFGLVLAAPAMWAAPSRAQSPAEIRIVELQQNVEIMPAGAQTWVLTQTNQTLHAGDHLRTGLNSRVALLWYDQSVVSFGPLSEVEILPPNDSDSHCGMQVVKGIMSFFHRDQPGSIRILTHGGTAGVEGTEFVLEAGTVDGVDRSTLSLIDGKVRLSNAEGTLLLTNHQQAIMEAGRAPVPAPGFIVNNVLQWCFYYPAVLDLRDLSLTAEETDALKDSLDAYRAGDLLGALAHYPESRQPGSDDERIFHAALLLSVGQVEPAEAELAALPPGGQSDRLQRLADALRNLIAAVKREARPSARDPQLPTELLAASYYEQSRAMGEESLTSALDLARRSTAASPQFGFAWARVAELEFGFGHTGKSLTALETSLQLSPRNAQALALMGFVLAAQNNIAGATTWFNRAIATDAGLGNAWLGRGLCRIRRGDAAGGRADLLVAAALEPQRALLRSYLGKAYADAFEDKRAGHELGLALGLDPDDPTAWLYSALLKQQENRINEAASDLEASQERNDNRSLFRSRLLLDEDQAVRSANLASIYRDEGMTDVSVREAARAVSDDYSDSSAHLFLSDAYNDLRDPTRFNLRYETVWFNELLLANLLSPVGAGRLSQNVSEQDYSRLLQADGLGFANSTTAGTDKSITELASQYGTFGRSSYALDLDYQHNNGVRVNNDLDSIEWYTTLKQQVTPDDTAFALIKYENYHSGDNFQYYDQNDARPNYRFDEYQQPIVTVGWHHDWGPGVHTLLFGGRLVDDQRFSDLAVPQLLLIQDPTGNIIGSDESEKFDVNYRGQLTVYTAELNQIIQWDRATLSAGARYQTGTFDTTMTYTNPPALVPFLFADPSDTTAVNAGFRRTTGYGYLTVEPLDRVWLTGGVAYDVMSYPLNFRNPPLTSGQDHRSQLGPKAAIVWEPAPRVTVRGMYARSLGGVSLDESYRLEPTQLAGFPQTFRTLISESVVGSVAAPEYDIYAGALDLKFPTKTYAGVQVEQLNSKVSRTIGDFSLVDSLAPYVPDSTPELLDYRETSVSASVNQLLGGGFALGASYKADLVRLDDTLPDVPVAALSTAQQQDHATLQQAGAYLLFNDPSGFYARADAAWYHQHNSGYNPAEPGDDFFQENIFAGYRCFNRRLEMQLGILNLGGQDYSLNPLNVYSELPRKRVFTATLNFIF
jgi:Tfp pilus assembly protein PilF